MPDKDFVKKYLEDFSVLIKGNSEIIDKIINVKDMLINSKKNKLS